MAPLTIFKKKLGFNRENNLLTALLYVHFYIFILLRTNITDLLCDQEPIMGSWCYLLFEKKVVAKPGSRKESEKGSQKMFFLFSLKSLLLVV